MPLLKNTIIAIPLGKHEQSSGVCAQFVNFGSIGNFVHACHEAIESITSDSFENATKSEYLRIHRFHLKMLIFCIAKISFGSIEKLTFNLKSGCKIRYKNFNEKIICHRVTYCIVGQKCKISI